MASQIAQLKECIESGDSVIEAYEKVDLRKMKRENWVEAMKIETVLRLVAEIHEVAGIE